MRAVSHHTHTHPMNIKVLIHTPSYSQPRCPTCTAQCAHNRLRQVLVFGVLGVLHTCLLNVPVCATACVLFDSMYYMCVFWFFAVELAYTHTHTFVCALMGVRLVCGMVVGRCVEECVLGTMCACKCCGDELQRLRQLLYYVSLAKCWGWCVCWVGALISCKHTSRSALLTAMLAAQHIELVLTVWVLTVLPWGAHSVLSAPPHRP